MTLSANTRKFRALSLEETRLALLEWEDFLVWQELRDAAYSLCGPSVRKVKLTYGTEWEKHRGASIFVKDMLPLDQAGKKMLYDFTSPIWLDHKAFWSHVTPLEVVDRVLSEELGQQQFAQLNAERLNIQRNACLRRMLYLRQKNLDTFRTKYPGVYYTDINPWPYLIRRDEQMNKHAFDRDAFCDEETILLDAPPPLTSATLYGEVADDFRALSDEEIEQARKEWEKYFAWKEVCDFMRSIFGVRAYKVEVVYEYGWERSYPLVFIQQASAYDQHGEPLLYDFTAPYWTSPSHTHRSRLEEIEEGFRHWLSKEVVSENERKRLLQEYVDEKDWPPYRLEDFPLLSQQLRSEGYSLDDEEFYFDQPPARSFPLLYTCEEEQTE